MNKKIQRIYVDTSVVGAIADDESRRQQTRPFWDAVHRNEIVIIVSDVLEDELKKSPQRVRDFFDYIPVSQIERVVSTEESERLASQYIAENVVGQSSI